MKTEKLILKVLSLAAKEGVYIKSIYIDSKSFNSFKKDLDPRWTPCKWPTAYGYIDVRDCWFGENNNEDL